MRELITLILLSTSFYASAQCWQPLYERVCSMECDEIILTIEPSIDFEHSEDGILWLHAKKDVEYSIIYRAVNCDTSSFCNDGLWSSRYTGYCCDVISTSIDTVYVCEGQSRRDTIVHKIGSCDSTVYVDYILQDLEVYVPNAVSPNGDGINDLFKVYPSIKNTVLDNMQIVDRWGNIVYHKSKFYWREDSYNFVFRNKKLSTGSTLQYSFTCGRQKFQGYFTLY